MSKRAACEWAAEVYDDSLKQMFEADEAYANGNNTKAIAYLKSQTQRRIPLIEQRVRQEGYVVKDGTTKMLKEDLNSLAVKIENQQAYEAFHKEVMRIDHKYAMSNYYAFAKCIK